MLVGPKEAKAPSSLGRRAGGRAGPSEQRERPVALWVFCVRPRKGRLVTRACPRGVLLPSPFPLSAFYFPELVRSKCDDDDDNDDHNDNADDGVITFLRHIL